MKKIVALAISLVMLFALVLSGCSSEKDALIGEWNGKLDMTDALNDDLKQDDPEMAEYLKIRDFSIRYSLSFHEDDTYELKVDRDAFETTIDNMKKDFEEGVIRYFEDQIAMSGMDITVEDILAEADISLDEMLEMSFPAGMFNEMFRELETSGNFRVDDGKLMLSDSYDTIPDPAGYELYTVDGNTLTIDEGNMEVEMELDFQLYPMVLKKAG